MKQVNGQVEFRDCAIEDQRAPREWAQQFMPEIVGLAHQFNSIVSLTQPPSARQTTIQTVGEGR